MEYTGRLHRLGDRVSRLWRNNLYTAVGTGRIKAYAVIEAFDRKFEGVQRGKEFEGETLPIQRPTRSALPRHAHKLHT